MVKAKFGASVRAKTPVAQVDEVLVKILCHNIVVLIQSMFELGIMPALFGQGLFLQSRPLSNRGGGGCDFGVEETDVCLLPDYRPAATLKAAQRVKPHGRHMTVCTETSWKCCFPDLSRKCKTLVAANQTLRLHKFHGN